MKFNGIKKLAYCLIAGMTMSATMTSCEDNIDDKLHAEAEMLPGGFSVVSPTGKVYKGQFSEDGSTVYIKINFKYDPTVELNGAKPTFFLSMGATVNPPMTEPQDFSDLEHPVEYTVTSADGSHQRKYYVTYQLVSVKVEPGVGFTGCEKEAVKTYTEMGYPGVYHSWVSGVPSINVNTGDLLAYPAFCGKDKLVMFSARYAWGDDGSNNAANKMPANHDYAFMVYESSTLEPAGKLNLGSLNPSDFVAITSDSKGNMVAAVGRKASGKTDFYYWTSPEDKPHHFGSADVSCDISNHSADGGSYLSVTGDITGTAVIAAAAPRSATGDHYRFQVYGGKVQDYTIIHTGYNADSKAWFQMISYFGPEPEDAYMIGYQADNPGKDNGQINVTIRDGDGANLGVLDHYVTPFMNGTLGGKFDDGQVWWARTGKWLERGGGHRPTVHAMTLNGVQYSYFTTGYEWRNRTLMHYNNMNDAITDYPTWGYGLDTQAKNPNPEVEDGHYLDYSFGMMCDWYFDDEELEGRVAIWSERFGVVMMLITCYDE